MRGGYTIVSNDDLKYHEREEHGSGTEQQCSTQCQMGRGWSSVHGFSSLDLQVR